MTAVEDYQAQTAALAAGTAAQVAAIFAAVQGGAVVAGGAAALIATVINRANAAGTSLADAYVSTQIEILTGTATPAIGLPPVDDTERLEQAVTTILDDMRGELDAQPEVSFTTQPPSEDDAAPDPASKAEMRLVRLAESEPLATTQRVAVEVMDTQPEVIGWRRELDADACELCRFLAGNGRVFKTTTPFRQHPRCNCSAVPVLKETPA